MIDLAINSSSSVSFVDICAPFAIGSRERSQPDVTVSRPKWYSAGVPDDEPVTDSPLGWVSKHIRRYVESDGTRGHRWRGGVPLLLTTRGRRRGEVRRTA